MVSSCIGLLDCVSLKMLEKGVMRYDLLCQTAVRKGMVCNFIKFVSQKYPAENTPPHTEQNRSPCGLLSQRTTPLMRSWMSGQGVPPAPGLEDEAHAAIRRDPARQRNGSARASCSSSCRAEQGPAKGSHHEEGCCSAGMR